MENFEYNTKEVLELAYAAYRVNSGYQKTDAYSIKNNSSRYSNKNLVKYTLYSKNNDFKIENFKPLAVTEEDQQNAENADKVFRRYTMLILGDSLNTFQRDMFAAYSNETTDIKKVGLVTYIPAFVDRELNDIVYKKRLKSEFGDSAFHTEKTFEDSVEILKMIPMNDFGKNLYIAGSNGNLVSFFVKDKFTVGATIKIKARVNKLDRERETGLTLSSLNYVKILKEE